MIIYLLRSEKEGSLASRLRLLAKAVGLCADASRRQIQTVDLLSPLRREAAEEEPLLRASQAICRRFAPRRHLIAICSPLEGSLRVADWLVAANCAGRSAGGANSHHWPILEWLDTLARSSKLVDIHHVNGNRNGRIVDLPRSPVCSLQITSTAGLAVTVIGILPAAAGMSISVHPAGHGRTFGQYLPGPGSLHNAWPIVEIKGN